MLPGERRNILIVPHHGGLLESIAVRLEEAGFFPKEIDMAKIVMERGGVQVYITPYHPVALGLLDKHSYSQTFFSAQAQNPRGGHTPTEGLMLLLLGNAPFCSVHFMDSAPRERQVAQLRNWARDYMPDLKIDSVLAEERFQSLKWSADEVHAAIESGLQKLPRGLTPPGNNNEPQP